MTQRRRFTKEEDRRIKELYIKKGIKKWEELAQQMENRTAKQCRDRYFNYLDPNIKNLEWTPEEDEILREKVMEIGNKWCDISFYLPGRGANNIKNRWNRVLSKEPWTKVSKKKYRRYKGQRHHKITRLPKEPKPTEAIRPSQATDIASSEDEEVSIDVGNTLEEIEKMFARFERLAIES